MPNAADDRGNIVKILKTDERNPNYYSNLGMYTVLSRHAPSHNSQQQYTALTAKNRMGGEHGLSQDVVANWHNKTTMARKSRRTH
jgi:hypothetical protein